MFARSGRIKPSCGRMMGSWGRIEDPQTTTNQAVEISRSRFSSSGL
ncbi:hypothetical protein P9F83_04695 [Peribacillus psychrosaccharolyticus]|nr:hypothetical protein [Peribacillus psychrosaccharolyticus]MEC2054539.1 hypothetical protein [Peribacillus psychrosaccharolyticus]MED3744234.1 hypothetical protein [Peribacillus psychrosaccharolyticus]